MSNGKFFVNNVSYKFICHRMTSIILLEDIAKKNHRRSQIWLLLRRKVLVLIEGFHHNYVQNLNSSQTNQPCVRCLLFWIFLTIFESYLFFGLKSCYHHCEKKKDLKVFLS